jgi:hypothetical protein
MVIVHADEHARAADILTLDAPEGVPARCLELNSPTEIVQRALRCSLSGLVHLFITI